MTKKNFVAKTHFLGILGHFRYVKKIWQDNIFLSYQVFFFLRYYPPKSGRCNSDKNFLVFFVFFYRPEKFFQKVLFLTAFVTVRKNFPEGIVFDSVCFFIFFSVVVRYVLTFLLKILTDRDKIFRQGPDTLIADWVWVSWP